MPRHHTAGRTDPVMDRLDRNHLSFPCSWCFGERRRRRWSDGHDDTAGTAVSTLRSTAIKSLSRSARPRPVVTSVDPIRTPVSDSSRVRNSNVPRESSPYSDSGRSASTERRKIRLISSEISRRTRADHSSRGSSRSSSRNSLDPDRSWPIDAKASANGLLCANAVSHAAPATGAYPLYTRVCRISVSNAYAPSSGAMAIPSLSAMAWPAPIWAHAPHAITWAGRSLARRHLANESTQLLAAAYAPCPGEPTIAAADENEQNQSSGAVAVAS